MGKSFNAVESENMEAAELLLTWSFLNNEEIWEELFLSNKVDRKESELNREPSCHLEQDTPIVETQVS